MFDPKSLRNSCACLLVLIALCRSLAPACADVVNGDFSAGYTGWTQIGLFPVRPDELGNFANFAPLGDQIALLETPESFQLPANDAQGASVAAVAADLGISPAAIAALGNMVMAGGFISQVFSAPAGSTLTFDFNHTSFDAQQNDYSFGLPFRSRRLDPRGAGDEQRVSRAARRPGGVSFRSRPRHVFQRPLDRRQL